MYVGTGGLDSQEAAPPPDALGAPVLSHLHLNSVDPDAAIAWYLRAYPSNQRTTLLGFDGIKAANGVTLIFSKVGAPPAAPGPDRPDIPQSAFWHHVWNVTDVQQTFARMRTDPGFMLIPQYLGPDGSKGDFSSDGLPGFLTTPQLEAARGRGATPTRRGGYFNWYGPDGVVMETLQGDAEMYPIVGMFQEQPVCAVLWYQTHLGAERAIARGRGEMPPISHENCETQRGVVSWPSTYAGGHYREPAVEAVTYSGVLLRWYINQGNLPLVSTRGQVVDHIALGVSNLDAWAAKLAREGVRILEHPHRVGGVKVMMIEGPSREAIELVQQG